MSAPVDVVAGLCSVTFRSLGPEEVVELAADNGLRAVEWAGDVHVPPGDEAAARRAARWCDAAGVTCASYGSYLQVGASDDAVVDATLDTAAALAVPHVRVWCEYGVTPAADADARGRVVEQLAAVTGAAATRNLTVSTEFHPGTLTETAASARRLLDEVGASNLFTYWQPLPGAPGDVLEGELGLVLEDVSHLHVFWWDGDGTRRPLAEGDGAWPALVAAARHRGRWPGPRVAFLEFVRDDEPAHLRQDAAVLRGWLGG
jgi:sugar phosphate isomerase/epimerase